MPAPRDVLRLLSRDELLALADRFGVELPERRSKERIGDALLSSSETKVDDLLLALSRERLKDLCSRLGLSTGGRDKAGIVARLLDESPTESDTARNEDGSGAASSRVVGETNESWEDSVVAMWRRVEIKNYRSIAEASVELAPFSVIVGPNGSGKSNFADALVFARDVMTDAATAVERRGGISALGRWQIDGRADISIDVRAAASREELDTDYVRHRFIIRRDHVAWEFHHETVESVSKGRLEFRLERTPRRLKMSHLRGEDVDLSAIDIGKTASAVGLINLFSTSFHQDTLRTVTRIRLNPDVMRQPQIASEQTDLDESGSNIAVAFRSLDKQGQGRVLDAMQRIVPGLTRISVEPFDRYLMLRFHQQQAAKKIATFSASEMSEGALRALGILVAAQQMTRDELLIIEEPEVAIHVGAANLLFDVLKDASSHGAVLITTHSADLLDAAREEEILVCDYRDGVTRIGPLANAQREVVRHGLFSVAELMRSEPLRIEGDEPSGVQL